MPTLDLGGDDLVVKSITTGATGPNQLSTLGTLILPAGVATAAPLTFTAGTNLTTAAAGAMEFDGNAFYATSQASSRQLLDAEQYIVATADSATYNNTGLDTSATPAALFTATTNPGITNGAVTLVAGKRYYFEAIYNLTNTGTTSHTWATLFGGTATFSAGTTYQTFGISGTTANTPVTGGLSGNFTGTNMATVVVATAASTSATEQVSIELVGTIVVNAGGTLIPQMQASARPGATGTPGVVFKAGSFFRIWQTDGGVVGNWS